MKRSDNIQPSFGTWLLQQKKMLIVAGVLSAVCFLLLKYCFPIPDFFNDSLNYIDWTRRTTKIQYRPLGYTIFLKFIHNEIGESSYFTVAIQYLLFLFSSLFCYFSADYLFGLPKKVKWPVLLVTILNPVLILQTNLISSDSLFCSLTVIWITTCFWIIKKRSLWALLAQVVFLYLCFQVRYTALFFPFIAIIAFLASRARLLYKVAGMLLTVIVIYSSINTQANETEQETGTRVFSGFSGWQIANNVLYYYKRVHVNPEDMPSNELRDLDKFVKFFIDSTPKTDTIGSVYLWDKHSPLKKYVTGYANFYKKRYFDSWFAVSVLFNEYGWIIIKKEPMAFVRYFILPNTKNFFYPETEVLRNYNCYDMTIDTFASGWMHINTSQPSCRFPELQGYIISIYPFLSLLLNIFNIAVIIICTVRLLPVWRSTPIYARALLITWSAFYFIYAAFSIFATVVTLRYMDPVFALGFILPFALLAYNKPMLQPAELPVKAQAAGATKKKK